MSFLSRSNRRKTIYTFSEYTMMDASNEADEEMLQDLQSLPEGGKEVLY